jgi:signal transduction histidine kinase
MTFRRARIQCRLDAVMEDINLDEDRAIVVFRVVQEGLANVARHAQASQVCVEMATPPGRLVVRVQDNGCGFNPAQAGGKRSLGLAGMRERVNAAAGDLQINNQPGRGTSVLLSLPLSD